MPWNTKGNRTRRRLLPVALMATVLAAAGAPPASAQITVGPPEFTGRWSVPFEEGGLESPICTASADEELACKPVAQAMGVLPDGRVFYFNGYEGQENAGGTAALGASERRDSQARILDLRSGTPVWSVPDDPTGGASNPDVNPTPSPAEQVRAVPGVAGVPGRAGDGLVGSAWGLTGAPGTDPTAPPDDRADNDGDMFCADLTSLPDGRLLIAGGADWHDEPGVAVDEEPGPPLEVGLAEAAGLRSARIFDPATDSFSAAEPMKYNRWYPSLVPLPDGRVLVAGGAAKRVKNTQASGVRRTETFDPETGAWTENYTSVASETSLPLSPRLHLLPNGTILYPGAGQAVGPSGAAADEALHALLQVYDPHTRQWEQIRPAILGAREGAASVVLALDPPYSRTDILTFGGTLGPAPGSEAGTLLSTITRVSSSGVVREELSRFTMIEPRWFPSAVGLPDGTVLAVGGSTLSDATVPGTGPAVRGVELFDIRTETWYSMARIGRDRTYHHSAVLLPDARVLLGGHAPQTLLGPGGDLGGPFPNNDRDPSFEVFTPHYLFRGPRPIISRVQAGIRWDEHFDLHSNQALDIEAVVLVRLPSPQHIIDSDQRTIRLPFTRHSRRLEVKAPPHGAIAPPGHYYLFIMRQTPRGPIPSMARIVRVGPDRDLSEALQPYPDDDQRNLAPGTAHEDTNTSPLAPVEERVEQLIGPQTEAVSPPTAALPAAAMVGALAGPRRRRRTRPGI